MAVLGIALATFAFAIWSGFTSGPDEPVHEAVIVKPPASPVSTHEDSFRKWTSEFWASPPAAATAPAQPSTDDRCLANRKVELRQCYVQGASVVAQGACRQSALQRAAACETGKGIPPRLKVPLPQPQEAAPASESFGNG